MGTVRVCVCVCVTAHKSEGSRLCWPEQREKGIRWKETEHVSPLYFPWPLHFLEHLLSVARSTKSERELEFQLTPARTTVILESRRGQNGALLGVGIAEAQVRRSAPKQESGRDGGRRRR
jgi:hypothetical protein